MSNGSQPEVAKKGTSPWVWVAIGCGALVVLGVVVTLAVGLFVAKKVGDVAADVQRNPALAAARLVVKANPDLEEVDVDEKAGTITVRQKSTGEVVTVSFEDLENGRLSFSTDKGKVTIQADKESGSLNVTGGSDEGSFHLRAGAADIDEVPEWVPRYPSGTVGGTYIVAKDDSSTGGFQVSTSDPVDVVLEHFRQKLKEAGFQVKITTISGDDQLQGGTLHASDEAGKRSVQIMVATTDDGSTATVGFTTGKE